MVVDLTKFDWSAIGAIGQVSAAVATIVSLWLLWRQIRLTRDQVTESRESLRLALTQVEESRRQANQARHDAVFPDLTLLRVDVTNGYSGYGDPIFTAKAPLVMLIFHFRNDGVGPAVDVRFFSSNNAVDCTDATNPSVPSRASWDPVVSIRRLGCVDVKLEMQWRDMFREPFLQSVHVQDDGTCIRMTIASPSSDARRDFIWEYPDASESRED